MSGVPVSSLGLAFALGMAVVFRHAIDDPASAQLTLMRKTSPDTWYHYLSLFLLFGGVTNYAGGLISALFFKGLSPYQRILRLVGFLLFAANAYVLTQFMMPIERAVATESKAWFGEHVSTLAFYSNINIALSVLLIVQQTLLFKASSPAKGKVAKTD